MGWPKTREKYRLYFDRKHKSYLLVSMDPELVGPHGNRPCLGELLIRGDPDNPRICTSDVSDRYTYTSCRRVSWNDLPEVWKQAFIRTWFSHEPVEDPTECRGLWRIGETPKEEGGGEKC